MNMNSGQDNSSIELWKAQQARVLSNDSIAVDYFCVSKSILNNIVIEKIKNEIYEYIHDLKAVLDEPYLIFKESGVAYFGNEKRVVPLVDGTTEILFFNSNQASLVKYKDYRLGIGMNGIDKSIIELKKYINKYAIGNDLNLLLRPINLNVIVDYYKNNNLPIPKWTNYLINSELLTESSKRSIIRILELKDKYIALGIKEYLEVKNKRRFILLFSSKLQVKTLNDFADYVIKHLCEPNHVKLSKYDNKYFDKLRSFVLDCKYFWKY